MDNTILTPIGTIAGEQAASTIKADKKCTQLLDYLATHPNVTIRYYKSNMVSQANSDASYLSEPNGRILASSYFSLVSHPDKRKATLLNVPVHILCGILKDIFASASDMETGGIFVITWEGNILCTTLKRWDFHKRQSLFQLTTIWHLVLQTTLSTHRDPEPWTCIFLHPWSNGTKTNTCLLESRHRKYSRLPLQASFSITSLCHLNLLPSYSSQPQVHPTSTVVMDPMRVCQFHQKAISRILREIPITLEDRLWGQDPDNRQMEEAPNNNWCWLSIGRLTPSWGHEQV